MSRKAAIGALALAALLCVTAYFVLGGGRGGAAAPRGPLLVFDPARVEHLSVRFPDGRIESVVRSTGGDRGWLVQLRPAGDDATIGWPANPTPVRSILSLLARLAPIREAEPGTKLDARAARIEIGSPAGVVLFSLGSEAIGGRALLRIDPEGPAVPERLVWIDAKIAESLVNTGLMPWRDRSVLSGFSRDVSRIRLMNAGGALALGKVSGRWGLREPVGAPADEKTVQRLIATLAGLEVARFFDGSPVPESVAFRPPMATLVVESDQREPGGLGEGFVTRTRRWSVEFREGGGLAAAELFTSVKCEEELAEPGKPPVVEIKARFNAITAPDRLAELSAAPDAYVARTACQTPAVDVGGLVVTRPGAPTRVFARSLDGWDEEKSGARVPCPPEEARAIGGVVSWLCGVSSAAVTTQPPGDWHAPATVELRTLGGGPLVVVEIGVRTHRDSPVSTRVGPVWRVYSREEAGAAADWLLGAP